MTPFTFSRAACVDVETTGTDPREDAILSASVLEVDLAADRIHRAYNQIFDPQRPISPRSTSIHGLVQEDVEGKPLFVHEASKIRRIIGELPVIGYNVQFDIDFLDKGFREACLPIIRYNNEFLDLMEKFKDDEGLGSASLDDAAVHFGLEARRGMHDAEGDAYIAARVACEMWKLENW